MSLNTSDTSQIHSKMMKIYEESDGTIYNQSEQPITCRASMSSIPLSQLSVFTKNKKAFEKYDTNKKQQKIGFAPKMMNRSVF